MNKEDIKLIILLLFFWTSAYCVAIEIILAINDIIVWLEQAAKVVEGLVKLVPVVMLVIYAVLVAYYCSHKK